MLKILCQSTCSFIVGTILRTKKFLLISRILSKMKIYPRVNISVSDQIWRNFSIFETFYKSLGNLKNFYTVFGNFFNLLWQIYIVIKGKILQINLSIWSHWSILQYFLPSFNAIWSTEMTVKPGPRLTYPANKVSVRHKLTLSSCMV